MSADYIPTEDEEQEMLFEWASMMLGKYPELESMYAIPNGGLRSKATAARMKRTGTKAGIPDICLPCSRHGCNALYIEMKRIRGGRLSPAQCTMIEKLTHQGNRCAVCHGFDEAQKEILDYLG